jgi:hypothetical protein
MRNHHDREKEALMHSSQRMLHIACASVVALLGPATATAQQPVEVRRFGENLSLTPSTTVAVTHEDARTWRGNHPREFESVRGLLTAFSLRISGPAGDAFRFAVDERDASRSDILLRCGSRAFNFDKLAAPDEKGAFQFGSRAQAGGFRVRGVDGRDHASILFTEQRKELHLIFFFDIPLDCLGEKLVFALTQEEATLRRSFEFDAGVVTR